MRTPKGQTMFNGRTAKVTVEVKLRGEVVQTFSVNADEANKLTIEVFPEHQLPKRSPLHSEALNLEDIKPGLNVRRCNVYGGSYKNDAIITGEPFKRASKFGHGCSQAHAWMVPVVTTNYDGKLVQEDWFLADMGVVPYERPDGSQIRWNDQNYTLAAS